MKNKKRLLIVGLCLWAIAPGLFSQTDPSCKKCSYEYMTIIVKEMPAGKLTLYLSRSDKNEMLIRDLSSISLEQFQYNGALAILSDLSKEGWRVIASNMAFENEDSKRTRLYFLLSRPIEP